MHARKFTKFKIHCGEVGEFRMCLFDFIDPHNSYLFSGIPPIYAAADKNKNNPVLL